METYNYSAELQTEQLPETAPQEEAEAAAETATQEETTRPETEKKTVRPRRDHYKSLGPVLLLVVLGLVAAAVAFVYILLPEETNTLDDAPVDVEIVELPAMYTAVFQADGVEVAQVEYEAGAASLEEPEVPEKEGYAGTWGEYTLDGDVTVQAVYTYAPWEGVVYGENLQIYVQPDTEADTVVTMKTGDTVTVISEFTAEEEVWCQTEDGWMLKTCIADESEGAEVAVALGIAVDGDWTLSAETAAALSEAICSVTDRGYDTAFMLVDLESGKSISYNTEMEFYCASTIKGPFVCGVLSKHPEAAKNNAATIQNVLIYSSNDGYTSLRSRYGRDCLTDWCEQAGVEMDTSKKWPGVTAEELCKLWMLNYEFLTTTEVGAEVAAWFECPAVSAIHNVLGETYTTQTKAGWISGSNSYYTASNDAGIVYAENGPYAVAILSNYPSNLAVIEPLVTALDQAHGEMN